MTTMSSDPLREALLRKTLKERLAAKAQQATVTKPTFPEMTLPEPPAQPQEPMGPPSSLAPLAPKASQGQRAGKAPAPPTTLTRATQPQRAGAAPAPAAGRDLAPRPKSAMRAALEAVVGNAGAFTNELADVGQHAMAGVGNLPNAIARGAANLMRQGETARDMAESFLRDIQTSGKVTIPYGHVPVVGTLSATTDVPQSLRNLAGAGADIVGSGTAKTIARGPGGLVTDAAMGEDSIAYMANRPKSEEAQKPLNVGAPEWWIENLGEQAPQMAASIGVGALTAGAGMPLLVQQAAAGLTMFGLEAQDAYEEYWQDLKAKNPGMSEEAAKSQSIMPAVSVGVVNAALEGLEMGEFFKTGPIGRALLRKLQTGVAENMAVKMLARGGAGALAEAATEVGQELTTILKHFELTKDPSVFDDFFVRIGTAAALAAGMGGPAGVASTPIAVMNEGREKEAAVRLGQVSKLKAAMDVYEWDLKQKAKSQAEGLDPGDENIPPEEKFKGEITDSLAASYADKSAGHANLAVQIEARVQNGDIDRNTASFFYRLTEDASGDHLGRIDITGQTAPIGEESGRNAAGHFAEDARGRLRIKISRYLQRSFDKGESEGFDVTPLATLLEEYAHAGHWAGLNEQQNAAAQSIRDSMTPEARQKFFLDLYDGDAEAAKYADSTYAEWLAHMAVAHWIGKPIPSSTLGKILDAMFTKFKNVIKKMRGLQIDPKLADIVEVMRTGRQPTVAEAAAPNAADNTTGVRSMPVADIEVDANTFQFKVGGNKEGVTGALVDAKAYDERLAGVIGVWYWPEKGKYYVVNGHHRLALAKRSGATNVSVKVLEAADPKEARALGALINIAEGRGSPLDAAIFIRDMKLDEATLRDQNLDLRDAVAKQGLALARLNNNLFAAFRKQELTLKQATTIGEAGLTDADQEALWKIIKRHKKMSEATLREFIAQVKSSDTVEGEDDGGLFPTDKTEINTGIFRAELTAYIADRLGSATRLFKYLSDEDRQAMVEQAGGGKIHGEATNKQAQVAAIAQAYFNARKHAKGSAIAEALSSAAVRLAKGANKNKVKAETLKTIVTELERAAKNKEAFARDIAKKRGEKGGLLFVDENAEEKRSAAGKKLADARRALMVKDREKFGELSSPTGGQHPIVDVHPDLKGVRVIEYVRGPFKPEGREPGPTVQRPIPIGSNKTIQNESNKALPPKSQLGDYNGGLDERQRFAVNLALTQFLNHQNPAFLLADGPGVGKTRQILVIADQIAKREQNKPILLITKSRQILAGSFRADRNALGISQSLRVKQGTYHDLRAGKYRNDDFGLVVFDESHGLKNPYSQQAEAGRMVKANHTLYVTATPIDKSWHSLYYLAALSGIPLEDYARGIGLDVSYEADPQTGEQKLKVKTVEGANPQDAMKEVAERTREAFDKGLIVRRHYPFWGNIKSTRATPDAAESEVGDYGEESVRAEEWWREHIKKSKPKKRRFLKGQMLFDLSRHVEPFKIEAAIERMQDTLKHGGQVVFVVESVNTTEIKGLTDQEPGTDAPIVGEERRGTGTLLHERLAELDIEAAKIHGPVTIKQGKYERTFNPNVSDEIRRFQSGELRVAIMTPQSGGTGVNLDDRKGDAPRTMIVLTTNFSAMDVEQIWFRISRRTTKSPSLIENLTVSGSYSDHIRGAIIRQKWQNMRRGQGQPSDEALLDNRDNGAFGRDIKDMLAGKVGTKPIEGKPGYVRIINEKTGEALSAGQFHEVNDAADLAKAIRRIRAERGVMRRAERLKEEDENSLFPKPKPEVLNADLPRKEGESEEDYRIRKKFREAEINTGKLFEQDDVKKYTDWRDGIEKDLFGRTVFHGSPKPPHSGFDSKYMRTGQGAHSFGWGHYFAESHGVARFHAESSSINPIKYSVMHRGNNPDYIEDLYGNIAQGIVNQLGAYLRNHGDNLGKDHVFTRDDIVEIFGLILRQQEKELLSNGGILAQRYVDAYKGLLNEVKSGRLVVDATYTKPPRTLYTVDVAPDDDVLLRWDKLFNDQPPIVQKAYESLIGNAGDPMLGGMDMYEWITTTLYRQAEREKANGRSDNISDPQERASKALLKHGVRGIKYLDGASRNKGEGTFNYVIFDDKDISIIKHEQFGRNFSMKPWAAEDAYRDAPPSTTGRVPSWLTSQFPTASQAMRVHMATEARVLSMRRKYPTIKSQMHLPIKVLARKFNTIIGAGSMTLDQFGLSEGRVKSLNPLAGSPLRLVASGGAEAVVFEEISTGIIYKFMPGAPSAKHGWLFGLRPTQVIKGHGTSVENGEGMSRLVERAAVLNRVGPATEFLGITDEGYAVYKQAKSIAHPSAKNAMASLSNAGVVMSYSDDHGIEHLRIHSSDPVPIVAVQGVVFGLSDLHGGNTAKGKTRLGILDPALTRLDKSMYRGPDAEVELVSDVKAAIKRDEAGYHQYRMFGRDIIPAAAMVKDRASAPPRIQVAKIVTPSRNGKGPKIKQMIERLGQIVKREVKRAGHARGSIGTYYPWTTLTSIRYHGDIDTSLHEASHALDDRFFIVGAWAGKEEKTAKKTGAKYWRFKKAPFDEELSLFWWHGSAGESGPRAALDYKRTEGVAEWVRAWVLNPTATEAVSPLFTAHFKSVVPETVRDALQDLGREIRSWAGSPAGDRLLSNVEVDPSDYTLTGMMRKTFGKKGWEYETPWYRRLQSVLQDALAPFVAGVNAAVQMQGVNLPPDSALFPSQNPVLLARLYAGIGDAVEEQFQSGPVDRNFKPVADVGGVAWLFAEMDQTSAKTLEQDVHDTIKLLIAERVIERIDRLLGIQHDVLSRHNEIGRLTIEYNNLKATKPRTKAIADRMADIENEIAILKREIAALMRKAGYKGPPVVDAFLRWVLDRRRNMVGTHGGVVISNTPGHPDYYGDEATMRQTIKDIQATPDRYTRLSESARRYRQWAKYMVLRPLLESGRLSPESYVRILDQNEFYVNMSRVMEEVYEPTKKVPASAVGRTASILPLFKGSRRMIMNPYTSLLDSAFRAQKEARRNEALRAFTALLTTKPTRGMHMGEARALAAIGHQVNPTDPGGIKVFRHGKPEYWVFEKEIHKALLDMGEWVAPVALRLATLPVSMTRTAIVYFPGFLVRNIPRDIGHRFLNTRVGSGVVLPLLKATLLPLANYTVAGVKSLAAGESVAMAADKALAAAGGETIREYRAAGGGQAGHYLHSEKNYYRRMKRELRKMASDPVSHVIATPGMIARGYGKLAQASELTNRRIEYEKAKKVAKKMGYNERDAVLFATNEARRIMDYQVAGRWMRVLNRFVLFLNPQIQGLKVTAESAMTRPASFLIRFSVGLLLPIIALRMLARAIGGDDDEEEYLNLPAYKRDLFYCIKLGTNRWLFIPKPYEMGVIASGVDRMISAYLGHEDAWHNYPKNIFNTVFPFDEGNMAGPMQAFVEAGANYDFFRDRSIIPWYEQDLPVWSRKGAQNSPGVSKLIAGAIGTDPRIVTHVLGSLTGDAGRIAMQATTPDGLDARAAFYKTLGILGQSPAFEAVAVERARKEAAALGQTGSKEAQYLGDLLDQWRQAKGNEERAAMAKRVRAFATQIRKQWEPSMKIIEQTGKRPTAGSSTGGSAALR